MRAAGINCDEETQFAWESAGAAAERIHVRRIIEQPSRLDAFQIITVPGGFSYGDDIASGKILANQLEHHLGDALRGFMDRGGLILGICNGFQVLVRLGLVPGRDFPRPVTLTLNDSGRYEDRWVHLRAEIDGCPFLRKDERYYLPVAHGEGKLVVAGGEAGAAELAAAGRIALRYVAADGAATAFPDNPNGSMENAAGLVDGTGRVFGLMPHPERYLAAVQHPTENRVFSATAADLEPGDGLRVFANAVAALR